MKWEKWVVIGEMVLATAMAAGLVFLLGLLFILAGCATSQSLADRPEAPMAEAWETTMLGLRIRVAVYLEVEGEPYCTLPDASNETRCQFGWTWLRDAGMLVTNDEGWESLTPDSARQMCEHALRPLGPHLVGWDEVNTCGNVLLYLRFRFLDPAEIDAPGEKVSRNNLAAAAV